MSKSSQFFEHILTHYRGIFATLILLPLSTLYTAYTTVRNGLVFKMRSAPAKHDQKVQKIIDQIEDWKQAGCTQRLCTARSGWKTMSYLLATENPTVP